MKRCLKLLGIVSAVVVNYGYIETTHARTNYICSYIHTAANIDPNNNRTALTISDEVLIPSQCPPLPADVFKADDSVAFSKHFTSSVKKHLTEEPHDLSCTHIANPPKPTPLF
jgi:hypothetical protein